MTPAQLSQHLQSRLDVPVGFREYQIRRPYPCGTAAVDELLGGFPRGAVSEISRNQSSNRTALTVSTLVHALDAGECCAWIDAGGTFDPESAAEAGLRLEQLLWINCQGQAEAALKTADLLLHGGGFGLIVFDLADVSEASVRRISMASWFRLRRAAEEAGTALITRAFDSRGRGSVTSGDGPTSSINRNISIASRGISPMIWRRLLVSSETTIAQLHQYIQVAFNWSGEHWHRFRSMARIAGLPSSAASASMTTRTRCGSLVSTYTHGNRSATSTTL